MQKYIANTAITQKLNLINVLFVAAMLLFFSSCDEDSFSQTIEIDPPPYEKLLVVHQFVGSRDSQLRVELTRNYGILETVPDEAYRVSGATVELWENGQRKLTLSPLPDSGWIYVADIPNAQLTAGATYELRAQHPDFPMLSSQQVLPAPVAVDSAVMRINGGVSSDGSELTAFDVHLKDPAGVRNFYMMQVVGTYISGWIEYTDPDGNVVRDTFYNEGYSYAVDPSDPNAKIGANNSIVVDDTFFDGQDYRFVFRTYRLPEDNEEPQTIIFRSITQEYYRYLISSLQKADSEDTPLTEPVPLAGNLTNGIGIFGMYDEQRFEVQ